MLPVWFAPSWKTPKAALLMPAVPYAFVLGLPVTGCCVQ